VLHGAPAVGFEESMGPAAAAAIVFPVRFVAGGEATQTTSQALGAGEIAVRCLRPPAVGTRVSMALYLPGLRQPEIVVAEVSESSPGGGKAVDAGFRARFLALHPEGRFRIDQLLVELERRAKAEALPAGLPARTREPAAAAPVVSRLFPRYAARFRVRFHDALSFIEQYADNISRGGLFIETLDPPELERPVAVVLDLPDGGAPISAAARVVHRVPFDEASKLGLQAGCGVQFLDTSDGFHERIEEYLARLATTPDAL
jgi:type IV pilus assembly protein PilZ